MRALALFPLVLALTGCFSVKEHSQSEVTKDAAQLSASHNSELEQHIASGPQPTIVTRINPRTGEAETTITPPAANTDTHYTEGNDVNAKSRNQSWFSEADSFPLFVKIIGLCFGVCFILAIIWYLRKQFLAVDAAFRAGDEALAAQIRRHRAAMEYHDDPSVRAHHAGAIADLEAERGRLKKK